MNVFLLILIAAVAMLSGVERFLNYHLEHHVTESQDIMRKKLKSTIAWIVTSIGFLSVIVAATGLTEQRS